MTTLELVDALEAGIAALSSNQGNPVPRESNSISPAALVAEMEKYGLSPADVAGATGVAREELDAWLKGDVPIPSWVSAVIRLTALLPLPARRRLRNHAPNPFEPRQAAPPHPFSRIDEL